MGAWIEIMERHEEIVTELVAPHDGCVDWNIDTKKKDNAQKVAPHDGCVDWNTWQR